MLKFYANCGKVSELETRDQLVQLPTPLLKEFTDYAYFRFMIDTGFLSQDIFYAGEHLLDERHFHLRKPHTLFQRSLRLIIINCGFFTQNEIVSYLQSSPNSVVRFLKKFYNDTIFGSILRLILNQRFKNKRRLESSSTSAKRKR